MLYVKSFLAGATAFIVTVVALSAISLALIVRYPLLAVRIFPVQNFDIQIGAHYYVNFPLWQIVAAGAVVFIIGFVWMFRRAAARTAG